MKDQIVDHSDTHSWYTTLVCVYVCIPGSPRLVASSQVVDVHDESVLVLADHVPYLALVHSLVLLHQEDNTQTE